MEYTKRDVARILNKRLATVEYYTREGLVVPEDPKPGRGKARTYSERNLVEFGMIEVMTDLGVPLWIAWNALDIARNGKWASSDKELLNKVHFEDFWVSNEWGRDKELVYIDFRGRINGESAMGFQVQVVERDETGGFAVNHVSDPGAPMATVLWLGAIKQAAVKLVFK